MADHKAFSAVCRGGVVSKLVVILILEANFMRNSSVYVYMFVGRDVAWIGC